MKIVSERWPIKYLVSHDGLCLGVDTKRRSFLFLVHRHGVILRERPVADKVVETLDYEIPAIVEALNAEGREQKRTKAGG